MVVRDFDNLSRPHISRLFSRRLISRERIAICEVVDDRRRPVHDNPKPLTTAFDKFDFVVAEAQEIVICEVVGDWLTISRFFSHGLPKKFD